MCSHRAGGGCRAAGWGAGGSKANRADAEAKEIILRCGENEQSRVALLFPR